ncbi:MAG: hypothetical protein WA421_16715 [Nitrososphaeraceae archaeon]
MVVACGMIIFMAQNVLAKVSEKKLAARLSGKDEMLPKIQKQLGLLNLLLAKVERQ